MRAEDEAAAGGEDFEADNGDEAGGVGLDKALRGNGVVGDAAVLPVVERAGGDDEVLNAAGGDVYCLRLTATAGGTAGGNGAQADGIEVSAVNWCAIPGVPGG